MPIHNWSQVRSGTYHNFHYRWIAAIIDRLNAGILPPGYFAMAEQIVGGPEPDVVALKNFTELFSESPTGRVAVAEPAVVTQPTTRFVMKADPERYAHKANQVVVRHELGRVHAVIEIISSGNKDSQHAIRSIVEKSVSMIRHDINLLIIDPFPPTPRDPQGLHQLIWNEVTDQPFELPLDRPLTMAAYQTQPVKTAYVEPIAIGSALPTMPLFLNGEFYVNVPLEKTYSDTWNVLPKELRQLVE